MEQVGRGSMKTNPGPLWAGHAWMGLWVAGEQCQGVGQAGGAGIIGQWQPRAWDRAAIFSLHGPTLLLLSLDLAPPTYPAPRRYSLLTRSPIPSTQSSVPCPQESWVGLNWEPTYPPIHSVQHPGDGCRTDGLGCQQELLPLGLPGSLVQPLSCPSPAACPGAIGLATWAMGQAAPCTKGPTVGRIKSLGGLNLTCWPHFARLGLDTMQQYIHTIHSDTYFFPFGDWITLLYLAPVFKGMTWVLLSRKDFQKGTVS